MHKDVFICEEHNEAFYVWAYALKQGLIQKKSTLVHFDDHSDLRSPVFNCSVNNLLDADLSVIRNFVYEHMKIDTFIIPSVYLNLFDEFIWIKNGGVKSTDQKMFVRSFNNEGKKLISGRWSNTIDNEHVVNFRYSKINSPEFAAHYRANHNNIILDIDLDYFSCCENPYMQNETIIEITEREYREFNDNKRYHYLNYITTNVEAMEYKGSYFYVLNRAKDIYPSSREVTTQDIDNRIDSFVSQIRLKQLDPKIITICRSRFSGFTPKHHWVYIENMLVEKLKDVYTLNIIPIDSL